MSMLRSKIPPLRVARLSKRTQFLVSETVVLFFGLSACEVVLSQPGSMHWATLVPCMLGYLAAFSLLLTTRCETCDEPIGREGKRLVAVPHTHCTRCGSSLG
jgi:hypothetical protein